MKNKLIFVGIFCLLMVACRKPVVLPQAEVKQPKKEKIKVNIKNVDYVYFHTKARLEYKDPDNQFTSQVNIRMRKDSVIWISVTPGLGLEAIRCLITKDSVYVINKLVNKGYNKYGLAYLSELFHFDFNLAYIQNLLLGNLCNEINEEDQLEEKNGVQIVKQKRNSYSIENFIDPGKQKIEKFQIADTLNKSTFTMSYSDFRPLDTMSFAYNNLILLNFNTDKGMYTMALDIDHTKAEVNDKQLRFPFNVPNRFEKKEK